MSLKVPLAVFTNILCRVTNNYALEKLSSTINWPDFISFGPKIYKNKWKKEYLLLKFRIQCFPLYADKPWTNPSSNRILYLNMKISSFLRILYNHYTTDTLQFFKLKTPKDYKLKSVHFKTWKESKSYIEFQYMRTNCIGNLRNSIFAF